MIRKDKFDSIKFLKSVLKQSEKAVCTCSNLFSKAAKEYK